MMMVAFAPNAVASTPLATIQFHNQALLQPDGSVLVTMDYSCFPGLTSSAGVLSLNVQQPQADGQASATATCDDSKHIVTLDAKPGLFTPGDAAASATVTNLTSSGKATQAELTVK
jgi:hypothetical protein